MDNLNWSRMAGIVLTLVGLAGYITGVYTEYPGRALSVTLVMVGITLTAIGQSLTEGES